MIDNSVNYCDRIELTDKTRGSAIEEIPLPQPQIGRLKFSAPDWLLDLSLTPTQIFGWLQVSDRDLVRDRSLG